VIWHLGSGWKVTVRKKEAACKVSRTTCWHPPSSKNSMHRMPISHCLGDHHEGLDRADRCCLAGKRRELTSAPRHCACRFVALQRVHPRIHERGQGSMHRTRCVAETVDAQDGSRCPEAAESSDIRFGCRGVEDDHNRDILEFVCFRERAEMLPLAKPEPTTS